MLVTSAGFLVVAALVLLAIVAVAITAWRGRAGNRPLTPLGGLALAFVLASLVFGEVRALGYGLMAVGVCLAVLDIVRRQRRRR